MGGEAWGGEAGRCVWGGGEGFGLHCGLFFSPADHRVATFSLVVPRAGGKATRHPECLTGEQGGEFRVGRGSRGMLQFLLV